MARHGCNMCAGTGKIAEILENGRTKNWTCSGCDGKGWHDRESWSNKNTRLPWNQEKEGE